MSKDFSIALYSLGGKLTIDLGGEVIEASTAEVLASSEGYRLAITSVSEERKNEALGLTEKLTRAASEHGNYM